MPRAAKRSESPGRKGVTTSPVSMKMTTHGLHTSSRLRLKDEIQVFFHVKNKVNYLCKKVH
jgi:hypothetical protein